MLPEYIKPKQKVIYWSPTLKRYVCEKIKHIVMGKVTLENEVGLPANKILCIQGAE